MSQRHPLATAFVAFAVVLGAAFWRPAQASIVPQAGDFTTHIQSWWGDPTFPSGMLLSAHYDAVYASTSGVLVVGVLGSAGHSMAFLSAPSVLFYLPAIGAIGPLTADTVDPSTTASGAFGGEMVSLTLNVDFSDAGYLAGAAGIAFGDLLLADLADDLASLNGMTIRQFLALGNTLLGGTSAAFDLQQFALLTLRINSSFEDGSTADTSNPPSVSDWAQQHLRIGDNPQPPNAVPEPQTSALVLLGLLGLSGLSGLNRRRGSQSAGG